MNSVDTLLQAAKYLEIQEAMQKKLEEERLKNAAIVESELSKMKPMVASTSHTMGQHQAALVLTSRLPAQQSVIHQRVPAPESTIIHEKKQETVTRPRVIQNSFDIINSPNHMYYLDDKKKRNPPMVFRAGTREVHNKLEKHRRAHLKECFDYLKKQLPPAPDEKKSSNLNILHSATRYIHILKKKQGELDKEMEEQGREKIFLKNKLNQLKKELSSMFANIDFSKIIPDVTPDGPSSMDESDGISTLPEIKTEEAKPLVLGTNGVKKISLPIIQKCGPGSSTSGTSLKEIQPLNTALSVMPVSYPLNQGLVLQKLAIMPKNITDVTPIVPTFIQQPLNGKILPIVNAQYVVGKCPLVVVSTANPRNS